MAEKATKRTSTTKQPSASAKRQAEALQRDNSRRKRWSVCLFALGLLIFAFSFGNPAAEEPNLWDSIDGFLRGLFGMSVFFVGPIIIYVAIMISADKRRSTILSKMLLLVFGVLFLCAAMQIFFIGECKGDFFVAMNDAFESGSKKLSGGGIVGIFIGFPLLLFGRVGATILIILIVFVYIMFAADISLSDFLGFITKPFVKIKTTAKEKRELYREDSEYVRAERDRLRSEREEQRALERKEQLALEHDEAERKARAASILATTTHGQQAVEGEAKPHELQELPNPMAEQQKDNKDFRDKLTDYIKGREPQKSEENTETVPTEKSKLTLEKKPEEPQLVVETTATVRPAETNAVIEAINNFEREEQDKLEEKAAAEKETEAAAEHSDEHAEIIAAAEQYKLPPVELLNDIVETKAQSDIDAELTANSETLVETLKSFGVQTKIVGVCRGPSVTRYELQPAAGVKISKITGLIDDIALNLATAGVRIEAPIPNKAAVGIEVPNKQVETVPFRSLVDSETFRDTKSKLGAVLGKDISGEIIMCDIAKMPHLLIAGTTGSGKSVCVNSIIMSILFRSTPEDVRLLMIDPKAVEFMIYNGIPHLLIPVVTDPKKAAGALGWAVTEMLNRYKLFADNNVRDLNGYNSLAKGNDEIKPLPQIVIFIDELADLMMASPGEVEDSICRLAQMARAAGMHLVIATQRPSVNVVTGVIKANIPSRIALKVASQVDSRTIIDGAGAEKLLGRGDMLYFPVGMPKPTRVQGCWVSDKEVERVVDFIKNSFILDYDESVIAEIDRQAELSASGDKAPAKPAGGDIDVNDDKLEEAIEAVIEAGQASTSYLQRKLKLGYGRAARLIDVMQEMGIVGEFEGGKPRQVIMTKQEWYERKMNQAK